MTYSQRMARIKIFEHGTQNIHLHKSEVTCFFQTVQSADGDRLIHLSTFGSEQRASGPKSSQSLQLARNEAEELVRLLREVFPGI